MNRQNIITLISESPASPQLKAMAISGVSLLGRDKLQALGELITRARALLEANDFDGFEKLAREQAQAANIPTPMLEPLLAQLRQHGK